MGTFLKKKFIPHILLSLCVLSTTASFVWWTQQNNQENTPTPLLHWNKNDTPTYRVTLHSESQTPLLEKNGNIKPSDISFEIDLQMHVVETLQNHAVVDISIPSVHHFSWNIMGQAHVDTDTSHEVLLNRSARAHITYTGNVTKVSYTQDPSPLFATVVQMVLQESRFFLSGKSTYSQEEQSPFGILETTYTWHTTPSHLVKNITGLHGFAQKWTEPVSHTQADGRCDFLFQNGHITNIQGNSSLTLLNVQKKTMFTQKNTVHMRYTGNTYKSTKTPDNAHFKGLTLTVGQPIHTQETAQASLERRVASMSQNELLTGFSSHASDRNAPDHLDWFWRASGLVKKDPSVGQALLQWFKESPRTSHETALVLDVLAAADTPQAQSYMQTAMDIVLTQKPQQAAHALQHMMMITTPTHDTVDYVKKYLSDKNNILRYSAELTLGSLSRQLFHHGDTSKALSVLSELNGRLNTANTTETEVLIRSIGNASVPQSQEWILPYATDEDAGVRRAVAAALRNMRSNSAQETLLMLMHDPVSSVQRSALESLQTFKASPYMVRTFTQLLKAESIHPKLFDQMLNIFTLWMKDEPKETEKALEVLLQHAPQESNNKTRAEKLLAQLRENP